MAQSERSLLPRTHPHVHCGALICFWAALSLFFCAHGAPSNAHVTLTTTLVPLSPPTPLTGAAAGLISGYGGSVVNQHLKLLVLLTLGIHLRVDAIIVPAVASRVIISDNGRSRWQAEPPHSLWDMKSIDLLLRPYGIKMVAARTHRPPPDSILLPDYYFRAGDISIVAEDVRRICREQRAARPAAGNLTLLAPDLILSLQTSELPLYAAVAAAVAFAPPLVAMADAITAHLASISPHFLGLHLRIRGEGHHDATNSSVLQELSLYYDAIKAQPATLAPIYLVSGIFSEAGAVAAPLYGVVESWLREWVVGTGHAGKVVNRNLMLGTEMAVAAGKLHSEQRAAVDFLVLLKAQRIFGSRTSTFAYVLQEARALRGIPRETMTIVGGPWWLLPLAAGVAVQA